MNVYQSILQLCLGVSDHVERWGSVLVPKWLWAVTMMMMVIKTHDGGCDDDNYDNYKDCTEFWILTSSVWVLLVCEVGGPRTVFSVVGTPCGCCCCFVRSVLRAGAAAFCGRCYVYCFVCGIAVLEVY